MTGLFIDISGKQEYIFKSNALKINIGASHIMAKHITESQIIATLNKLDNTNYWTEKTLHEWKNNTDTTPKTIVFIGGGSALLAFDTEEKAIEFNKIYTKAILTNFPGVYVNVTILSNYEEGNFKSFFDEIKINQKQEINCHSNVNEPFVFGIEDLDTILGKPITHKSKVLKDNDEVSQETDTKVKAAKESENYFKTLLETASLSDKYAITNEMDEIIKDENNAYMAVVHIDGNRMGEKFANAKYLKTFRSISINLNKDLDAVLIAVLKKITDKIDAEGYIIIDKNTKVKCDKSPLVDGGKWIIPFRPIISAGDDITFVCHGRLGFYIAEQYLLEMMKKDIYACAGIAMAHTKFPFYKAYLLAEELCGQGKKASREYEFGTSWIQFYRSTSGFAGNFERIIKKQFNNRFKTAPYLVGFDAKEQGTEIISSKINKNTDLKAVGKKLADWNNTKILQLRDALKNEDELNLFFKIEEKKNAQNQMCAIYKTQYNLLFDAIEMRGFILNDN